jgi:hypothetical protein
MVYGLKVTANGDESGRAVVVVESPEQLWLCVKAALSLSYMRVVHVELVSKTTDKEPWRMVKDEETSIADLDRLRRDLERAKGLDERRPKQADESTPGSEHRRTPFSDSKSDAVPEHRRVEPERERDPNIE